MPDAPKVFISYSHDDEAHEDRVLALADRLRGDGIDAEIDQYEIAPPEGWPAWCEKQIKAAGFVLLVCTETYLRRVDGEEEPGKGHGVLWEARIIRQLLYDSGSVSAKFIPILFSDGSADHIPTPVKGATQYVVDTERGFTALCRQLTNQPGVRRPPLGKPKALPPKERKSAGASSGAADATTAAGAAASGEAPPPGLKLPHPLVEEIFAGRAAELRQLTSFMLPADGRRRPVVVRGMGGVGKSYLVDRFFTEKKDQFPGGYVRSLDPEKPGSGGDLVAMIADRLKLPPADEAGLAARLQAPLTLVHVENVDTEAAAAAVGDAANRLRGCAFVASARYAHLAAGGFWREVVLEAFDEATGLDQLRQELGEDLLSRLCRAPSRQSLDRRDKPGGDGNGADAALLPIVRAFGGLPLALHLAAGHLRAGETPESFLELLGRKALGIEPIGPGDPTFMERSRKRLDAVFELSLAALARKAEERGHEGAHWLDGLYALGYGPAAGVGESLGAAFAGLKPDVFAEMTRAAHGLSLLDRVPRGEGHAWRLHPLLAELGRSRSDRNAALARLTDWFCERLPEPDEGEAWRWNEVHAEAAALIEWLPQVAEADRQRVLHDGSWFAINTGPFHAWRRFCEEMLSGSLDDSARSNVLWTLGYVAMGGGDPDRVLAVAEEKRALDRGRGADRNAALASGLIADILQARGQLDDALRIRQQEELPVYDRLGNVRSRAVTMGRIADILRARGQLDDALRIRQHEELPVYDRLGDVRARAVTMGKIADILYARGQLDDALRIRQHEQLPVYDRLGDVRERAVTMGKIADILQARGQLDDALRIRQQEQLPVYERLGDVRSRAVTMGKIADILYARGQLDDALRIRKDEELPVYERLGDVRGLAVTHRKIADILESRGDLDEALRILREESLPRAQQLGAVADIAVFQGRIADILHARGQLDEALRIRQQEELPVYERLGDVRSRAVTMGKIATILADQGQLDEAIRMRAKEVLPAFSSLGDARELLVGRWWLATHLLRRGAEGDREDARQLLCLALAEARRMKLPMAADLEAILQRHGLTCG